MKTKEQLNSMEQIVFNALLENAKEYMEDGFCVHDEVKISKLGITFNQYKGYLSSLKTKGYINTVEDGYFTFHINDFDEVLKSQENMKSQETVQEQPSTLESKLGKNWKKNYWFILDEGTESTAYHRLTPMKYSNAWKIAARYIGDPKGERVHDSMKLYAIPNSRVSVYKPLSTCTRYYRGYVPVPENLKEAIDISENAWELAETHKYLDFILITAEHNIYIKAPVNEFDEAIRILHRRGLRNIRICKVEGNDKRKVFWANHQTTSSKQHWVALNPEDYQFEEYHHVTRVSPDNNFSSKNGFILFVKQNNVDRFIVINHTTGQFETSESEIIRINGIINSFVAKIQKKLKFTIVKMVAFYNYRGIINEDNFKKYLKKGTIGMNHITDYECTDILSKAQKSETVQAIDNAWFYKQNVEAM